MPADIEELARRTLGNATYPRYDAPEWYIEALVQLQEIHAGEDNFLTFFGGGTGYGEVQCCACMESISLRRSESFDIEGGGMLRGFGSFEAFSQHLEAGEHQMVCEALRISVGDVSVKAEPASCDMDKDVKPFPSLPSSTPSRVLQPFPFDTKPKLPSSSTSLKRSPAPATLLPRLVFNPTTRSIKHRTLSPVASTSQSRGTLSSIAYDISSDEEEIVLLDDDVEMVEPRLKGKSKVLEVDRKPAPIVIDSSDDEGPPARKPLSTPAKRAPAIVLSSDDDSDSKPAKLSAKSIGKRPQVDSSSDSELEIIPSTALRKTPRPSLSASPSSSFAPSSTDTRARVLEMTIRNFATKYASYGPTRASRKLDLQRQARALSLDWTTFSPLFSPAPESARKGLSVVERLAVQDRAIEEEARRKEDAKERVKIMKEEKVEERKKVAQRVRDGEKGFVRKAPENVDALQAALERNLRRKKEECVRKERAPKEAAALRAGEQAALKELFDDEQQVEGEVKAAQNAGPVEDLDEEELAANRNDVEVFLREHRERRFEAAVSVNEAAAKLGLPDQETPLEGMRIKLLPFQIISVAWMADREMDKKSPGGILADDMGLGKTVQTLAIIASRRSTDPEIKTNLIVVPLSLIEQWATEIKTKAIGLSVVIYHGSNKKKPKTKEQLLAYDVVITTHGTLSGEFRFGSEGGIPEWGLLFQCLFYRCIVDEAHIIRNPATRISNAVAKLDAVYRWLLTGTPVINKLTDVFPYFRFLRYAPWFVASHFKEFITKVEKNDAIQAGRTADAALSKILLRRKKDDLLEGKPLVDLRSKTMELIVLHFDEEERRIYDAAEEEAQVVVQRYLKEGSLMKNMSIILTLILRLRQATLHPSLIFEDPTPADLGDEIKRARKILGDAAVDDLRKKRLELAVGALTAEAVLKEKLRNESLKERLRKEKLQAEGNIEEEDERFDYDECPVCMEPIEKGSGVVTPCRHVFCRPCAGEVLSAAAPEPGLEDPGGARACKKNERPCPNCRQPFSEASLFLLDAFEPSQQELAEATRGLVLCDDKRDVKPNSSKQEEYNKSQYSLSGIVPSTKMNHVLERLLAWRKEDKEIKTIVISSFVQVLDLVDNFLTTNRIASVRFQGDCTAQDRKDALKTLAEDPKVRVMLLSLKAGGVGLNLTMACRVINMDLAWSEAVEMQACDRVHRLGQSRDVLVERLTVDDTIEQRIQLLQQRKRLLSDMALREGQGAPGHVGPISVPELLGVQNSHNNLSRWDDYVDAPSGTSALALPVAGFEGGEGGVYGGGAGDEVDDTPIFSLGRVQFALPSPLHSLSCTSNILLLTLSGLPRPSNTSSAGGQSPQLIRIDLDKPTEVENIDLPSPPPVTTRDGVVSSLHRVHVDPTGRHVVISTTNGDNFYVFIGTLPTGGAPTSGRRAKPLARLKGAIIESVSWTPSSTSASSASFSTREILLGTANGQILETTLLDPSLAESSSFSIPVPGRSGAPERYVKLLYTLPERQGITGLKCETWGKRATIIATTKTRIYQFVGSLSGKKDEEGGMLEAAFQPYVSGEAQPKSLELPGEPINSELHFFAPLRTDSKGSIIGINLPKNVAWLTGPGIYHGALTFPPPSSDHLHPGDGVIESASLVPYPAEPSSPTHLSSGFLERDKFAEEDGKLEMPISMALTEWHFILLYEDKIRVIGLLSDRVVYEEALDLPPGVRPIRLSTDPLRKTYWMHTDQSIFELVVKDEDRDVWKIYLARSNWELARRYAKTSRQRDNVLAAEADAYFASGRYIQSAQCYAQSSKSFEEVVLRFVDKNERDALRYYLGAKLERLRRTDLTQRMMLATWLVEIYLSKISQLEDIAAAERASEDVENYTMVKGLIEDDMCQFLTTYKDNLDPTTVFNLLASHGRDEMTLYYAGVVGDHERIITHWILEEDWLKALEALNKQENLDLYYRFAPVLIRRSPQQAIETFMRQPNLDVRRLIPAMSPPKRSPSDTRFSIKYLQYSILQLQNTDASVHNTLLTLYATDPSPDAAELLHFLAASPDNPHTGAPYYDLDYALRLCRSNKRVQACVLIYSKMGLYESSVDLALANDDLELAKINADKPEDDDILRKKLWLKIARYVVGQKNDIKTAMRFLESTDLLKIEDILPFFPDFVVIDDFKDEICTALEGYSAHIERLKEDMDEATRSAEAIKGDIADLRNRFVVVDAAEKCGSCGQTLLTRQFYVFPCQHVFHADCLINEVTKHLSPANLRRMLDLQSQLSPPSPNSATTPARPRRALEDSRKLAAASVQGLDQLRKLVLPDALLGIIGGAIPGTTKLREVGTNGAMSSSAKKEAGEKQGLREALDDLLASSCVLCEGAIASVDRPFVDDGEEM